MKKLSRLSALLLAVILSLLAVSCGYDGYPYITEEYCDTTLNFETNPTEYPTDTEKPQDTERPSETAEALTTSPPQKRIDKNGSYTAKEDVALYIRTYGKLPKNFITKDAAEKLGWNGGGLEKYAKGKCIGGDRFGNFDGDLPRKKGRTYYECDIDTLGATSRGAKRLIYSNDGLIYYTEDHYETFELLYGDP